jgi:hypothetical protein
MNLSLQLQVVKLVYLLRFLVVGCKYSLGVLSSNTPQSARIIVGPYLQQGEMEAYAVYLVSILAPW